MSSPTTASTVTGNSVTNTHSQTRTWQARITYSSITDNATTYSITLVGNWYCSNVGTGSYTSFASGKLSATMSGGASGTWSNSSKVNWPGKTAENLITRTLTVAKTHATQSKNITFSITAASSSDWKGTSTVTLPISVSPKTYYTVSYNANGGSGAPGAQTKWYNETLTLSSTRPTKSGYTFLGWSTSSTATSASYSAGGSYTSNAGATLYAIWRKTITVSYNAN